MPVTLYLTTGSNDVGLFNIYSGSIVDDNALLEAQVTRDRLVAGWCTDVETTVYTIQSSTTTCQSKAYANVALFRCDLEITATGTAPTPIPVPQPVPVPSPTAPTAPTPQPQPVPQPTAPVAPQPVPAPTVSPVPQPQPVAPVPAPAAPVPAPAAPVPVPAAPVPVPQPVPAPVSCGEWELEGGPGGSGLFQYTDCVTGTVQQESVEDGDSGPVCSRDTPSLISGYGTQSYLGTCTS